MGDVAWKISRSFVKRGESFSWKLGRYPCPSERCVSEAVWSNGPQEKFGERCSFEVELVEEESG